MRKILPIFLLMLLPLLGAEVSGRVVSNRLFCSFDMPKKWTLDTTLIDQISLICDKNPQAVVSINRYMIEEVLQLRSDDDLREAIGGLYFALGFDSISDDDVQFTVDNGVANFATEFSTYDTLTALTTARMLRGSVVRLSDGRQVLYLILGSAPESMQKVTAAVFEQVTGSFEITAGLSDNLYAVQDFSTYLIILLILMLMVFFYTRNRRVQRSRNPLGKDSRNFWRCPSCARVNHIHNQTCNRCGADRVKIDSIRK
ncbi:MAG: hypothetical protein JSU69_00250 [Candidatus Zixiibacteriota bacterium]|nr:MAG: hypothetical protein JSU69_00250 [candidate division Zixibacteria bacterium]